jgi:hypothetical protein
VFFLLGSGIAGKQKRGRTGSIGSSSAFWSSS